MIGNEPFRENAFVCKAMVLYLGCWHLIFLDLKGWYDGQFANGRKKTKSEKMLHRNALRLFLTVLEVSQLVASNEKIKTLEYHSFVCFE